MPAYYNEIDPYAAEWLRNLIAAGHIAPGDVDERSIADVRADDLKGYVQCHFFAGIGVWSHALRTSGWHDDRPVWTGSCPCQPFSAAGKGEGAADPRHLWPTWFSLIETCLPPVVFGEQVASSEVVGSQLEASFVVAVRSGDFARANGIAHKLARSSSLHYWPRWVDSVCAEMEGIGYAMRLEVLGAHSVGAPHIRQRLYFVADSRRNSSEFGRSDGERAPKDDEGKARKRQWVRAEHSAGKPVGELADADGRHPGAEGLQRGGEHGQQPQDGGTGGPVEHAEGEQVGLPGRARKPRGSGVAMGDTERQGLAQQFGERGTPPSQARANARETTERAGPSTFWSACDWLPCIDGKARPVEPGTFPLAHGVAGRVGRLRAYGNAIVAPAAAEFVKAYLDR